MYVSKICCTFAPKLDQVMDNYTPLNTNNQEGVSANGVILSLVQPERDVPSDVEISYPYITLSLTLSGTAHFLYDMKDMISCPARMI